MTVEEHRELLGLTPGALHDDGVVIQLFGQKLRRLHPRSLST
jgi:hypothetical protein